MIEVVRHEHHFFENEELMEQSVEQVHKMVTPSFVKLSQLFSSEAAANHFVVRHGSLRSQRVNGMRRGCNCIRNSSSCMFEFDRVFFETGGQTGFSGGNRPTGGLGRDGTGRGDRGDSYMARIEMAPMARDAA